MYVWATGLKRFQCIARVYGAFSKAWIIFPSAATNLIRAYVYAWCMNSVVCPVYTANVKQSDSILMCWKERDKCMWLSGVISFSLYEHTLLERKGDFCVFRSDAICFWCGEIDKINDFLWLCCSVLWKPNQIFGWISTFFKQNFPKGKRSKALETTENCFGITNSQITRLA